MTSTQLSFDILETNNCNTMAILDTSVYLNPDVVEGKVLQIQPPNGYDLIETNYNQSAVTLINTNVLTLTSVSNSKYLEELPDGLYTIKISVCPYDIFWAEKQIFRTCQIWCKFYKAFLKTKINGCSQCLSNKTLDNLRKAEDYLIGVDANITTGNFSSAAKNYEVANSILDKILDCDCK